MILDTFMCENNLDWTNCFGVCNDSGRSMSGCYGRLQALIRRIAPDALWIHSIIHSEALASKDLRPTLNLDLKSVFRAVNFIKTRPQDVRVFFYCVRIWDLSAYLCCITIVRDGCPVAMCCPMCLNCNRNSTLILKNTSLL